MRPPTLAEYDMAKKQQEKTMAGPEAGALKTSTDRRPKHLEMDDAIQYMDTVISHAQSLINQINPTPDKEEEIGCDRNQPSLIEVLDNGPNRLRKQAEILHQQLDNIGELIF